jgi:hypothetical protein
MANVKERLLQNRVLPLTFQCNYFVEELKSHQRFRELTEELFENDCRYDDFVGAAGATLAENDIATFIDFLRIEIHRNTGQKNS